MAATTASLGPSGTGSKTVKPRPPAGPPSAWMSTDTSAWAALMMAARVVTHGPTPSLFGRVSTTPAPSASRSAARYVATLKLNWASVYPPSVAVPVVSHASSPVPLKTGWSMTAGALPFNPLWPGSIPTTLPASGSDPSASQ